jgi:hypothetical protein
MSFARRALQRRLDELRMSLNGTLVDKLVSRLNRPGRDQLSAMWEVVVLHALSKHGMLRYEDPLPSGHRPDMGFAAPGLSFAYSGASRPGIPI